MSDLEIIVFAIASVVIILISLYVVISMTKDINITIRECEKIGVWAKKSWKGDPMGAYDCDCINNLECDRRERKQKEQPQSTTGQLNDGVRSTAQSTDFIDRQDAIDALDCINGAEEVLRSLPPAQPKVIIGHWIQYDKRFPWRHHYKCSVCGNYLDFSGVNGGRGEVNFCPNCGAKMKGERQK